MTAQSFHAKMAELEQLEASPLTPEALWMKWVLPGPVRAADEKMKTEFIDDVEAMLDEDAW